MYDPKSDPYVIWQVIHNEEGGTKYLVTQETNRLLAIQISSTLDIVVVADITLQQASDGFRHALGNEWSEYPEGW